MGFKDFLYQKFILIVALGCEVVALLMRNGTIGGSELLVNRLTVAGAVIVFIYLVITGLRGKYHHYAKKWRMGPYADLPPEIPDDSKKNGR